MFADSAVFFADNTRFIVNERLTQSMLVREGLVKDHAGMLALLMWCIDIIMPAIAGVAAYWVYPSEYPVPEGYYKAMLVCTLFAAVAFPRLSLSKGWRGDFIRAEIQAVSWAVMWVFVALALAGIALGQAAEYSRVWFFTWCFATWFGLSAYRVVLRLVLRYFRSKGFNQRHIVVVGEGQALTNVLKAIDSRSWTGYRVAGVFCDDAKLALPHGYRVQGSLSDVAKFASVNEVDQIWVTMALKEEDRLCRLLEHDLRHATADIRYIPDFFGYRLFNHSVGSVVGMPVIDLSASPMDGLNRVVKAIEDKVLAFLILLLISPLFIAIAIGCKLSSPGPVFFRQPRLSWNGKVINVLKFRTMPVDAEAKTGPVWSHPNDQRATAFGQLLRRTSLDELPQFINVLKGEMSIVGPRPERPVFVEQFKEEIPDYMKKHVVKAGITGWAQVNGWRGDTDLSKRIEHDLYYIRHWSLLFDLKIILLTFVHGFVHKNAH